MLQTEFEFTLPRGYVDENETLHRTGHMRLATAADEILPLRDARSRENAEYLIILILSRVIVDLGGLQEINEAVIEKLFIADLSFLQDLYNRINGVEQPYYQASCPHCKKEIRVPINFQNEVG